MSPQEKRLVKLRKILFDKSEALLITNEKNIYYFSGFQKSEGVMFVTDSEAYLLVDFRYYEAACKKAVGCKVVLFKNLFESLSELLKKMQIHTVYIESQSVTLDTYYKYQKFFNENGISLFSDATLDRRISNLRIVKSEDEISFIEQAQKITEKAYNEVLNYVKPGVTERTVSLELEYLIKKYGAEDVSFDLITITGKKTSLPHGVPGDDVIAEGDFFTMDIGAVYKGYHSDMTRTVAVKSCGDNQREIYNIVLNAQLSALKNVTAGVKASYVDSVARKIIDDAGYSSCFGHSTGHGVGLDIHELPNVSPKSDYILSEGMIITVEPGIYIENQFGVRIEDMVAVCENGYKNFASLPKELIIV